MEEKTSFEYKGFKDLVLPSSGVNGKKFIQCNRNGIIYTAAVLSENKDFIGISSSDKVIESTSDGNVFAKYQLKFHISLPEEGKDEDNSDFAKGFKIISDILMDNAVNFFKVIKPSRKMSDQEEQRGKDVTIYAKFNKNKTVKDWQVICVQITGALTKNNIGPGYKQQSSPEYVDKQHSYPPKEEKYISGCNYISYRYEGFDDKRYETKEGTTGRKKIWIVKLEFPTEDLCAKIVIDVPNQKPNLEWNPVKNNKSKTDVAEKNF